MEAKHFIKPDIGLVGYEIRGKASLQEMIDLYAVICGDPDFSPDFKGIADWRFAESNLKVEEIKQLVEHVKERRLSFGAWVALVDLPKVTALAEIYAQSIHSLHPLYVCSTLKEASRLLDIDLAPLLPKTNQDL